MRRRDFLASAMPLAAACATARFDADFGTAVEAAEALRKRRISSVELTEHVFRRLEKYDSKLNAVVVRFRDEALRRARQADEALRQGRPWGPLHGVPVTVKESFGMEGVPTTAGVEAWKDFKPERDSAVVERLSEAGAIIIGKTNVPPYLMDWQADNPMYGRTNNPWDETRTSGGSTGGGAASIAAGLGFLTTGSDIGGSIRIPSHFCGVYGHKPSYGVVPQRGHVPPKLDAPWAEEPDINVVGPMARSAADLALGLEVLGGPAGSEKKAWSWRMPAPRHRRLRDFRVGVVTDDPLCPVGSDVRAVLEETVRAVQAAGVKVDRGWPEGVDPGEHYRVYRYLLTAVTGLELSDEQLAGHRVQWQKNPSDATVASLFEPHSKWLAMSGRRMAMRAIWEKYFESHDVMLMPVGIVAAFPHQAGASRILRTPEAERDYLDLLWWVCFASLAGLPATVAPAGFTGGGLPVGVQIVGSFLEDATPIEFAARLAEVTGGHQKPKGY